MTAGWLYIIKYQSHIPNPNPDPNPDPNPNPNPNPEKATERSI